MIMKTKHVMNTEQMVRRGQIGKLPKGGKGGTILHRGIAPFAPKLESALNRLNCFDTQVRLLAGQKQKNLKQKSIFKNKFKAWP